MCSDTLHDVVVIGAGAAGVSAAIECFDIQLDVVVVEATSNRSAAKSTRSPTRCATWRRRRTETERWSMLWLAMPQRSVIAWCSIGR